MTVAVRDPVTVPAQRWHDDVWTTRRGKYRALYTINDADHTVTVVAAAHRRNASGHR